LREDGQPVEAQALCKEFVFPADLAAMIAARDAVMDFVHQHSPNEELELDILIALQEALANAVTHGCGNDPSKTILCSVSIDSSATTIVVKDSGQGFETADAADTSDDGSNLTEHGRGILLMRSLMDEVNYRHHGSEVRLKKYRTRTT
jgi:serine/threonine-protein kinase RsbW